jgi:hypothetical protein
MPEFVLNRPHWWPSAAPDDDADLRDFACGYVEAMFFTNGDCGDERLCGEYDAFMTMVREAKELMKESKS